jgi:hypothetical protein
MQEQKMDRIKQMKRESYERKKQRQQLFKDGKEIPPELEVRHRGRRNESKTNKPEPKPEKIIPTEDQYRFANTEKQRQQIPNSVKALEHYKWQLSSLLDDIIRARYKNLHHLVDDWHSGNGFTVSASISDVEVLEDSVEQEAFKDGYITGEEDERVTIRMIRKLINQKRKQKQRGKISKEVEEEEEEEEEV